VKYVTDSGNEADRPRGIGWAVLGLFWVGISYQIAKNEPDVRGLAAYVSGCAAALVVWAWHIRSCRQRWWKTALSAACVTVAALAVAHYLVGGVQTQLIQFLAEWGPETALLVASGPVTALHLISAGLGWGRPETSTTSDSTTVLKAGAADDASDVAGSG
jgi:hypothetical protein